MSDPFATADAEWQQAIARPDTNGATAATEEREPLPPIRHPQLGEPVAVYRYERASGDLAFVVCRFEHDVDGKREKDFRPAQLKNGRWAWNVKGAPVLLYRLPDVERALAASETVWIVDGEKDADALASAGVCATTWAHTQSWTIEHAEQLTGARRARIVGDRDNGAGARQAHEIRESLIDAGSIASVDVELVQAAEGKDAHDHLAAGRGLDEFEPLAEERPALEALPGGAEGRVLEPFVGLTHDEALLLELPAERQLIRDLVPVGAVGTIAGVPETHKSWLAQAIAVRVAQGEGSVLGCDVVAAAAVGYFWQDDSTREEAERIKTFQAVHEAPAGIPLRWFLNEGLQLPADLGRLVETIRTHGLGLVVLDSFYNFLPGIDLKDEGAEQIVARLKREVSDATGCTVLIVDHMPWATDANRQRLRAYGGVFKNAATRFGIYIDAVGKNLSIEARGNNIRGFKKHPAYWDDDALELRLVEAGDHEERVEERAEKVAALLETAAQPLSKTAIRSAVGGRAEITDQALELLKGRDRVVDLSALAGTGVDSPHGKRGWIATVHAGLQGTPTLSLLNGTAPDSLSAIPTRTAPVPSPIGDRGMSGQGQDEVERLEALAEEMGL